MPDVLSELTELIASGSTDKAARPALESLFGGRYHKRYFAGPTAIRDAFALASGDEGSMGVPWAGLVHPDNPPSGMYGGASVVWFPSKENGSLLTLVVGTRGLSPDEGLLMRPGHRRRIFALRRHLANLGVDAWSKPDPSLLTVAVPRAVQTRFSGFEPALNRYGQELYCVAKVPDEPNLARKVVQAFFDLYAYERGWQVLAHAQVEFDELLASLRDSLFTSPGPEGVHAVLMERRFVVLQGPPGTGKTRLAELIKRDFFRGKGATIQFHPAVTYEDFVIGLSPNPAEAGLKFTVRPGKLLQAASAARGAPHLLVIDEINRADLSKILGEAIYLFEAGEVGGENPRTVRLPHELPCELGGTSEFSLPEGLYILGTMNTADRSISGMDLAVQRRFSFINVPPDRRVVVAQGLEDAVKVFDMLLDVFVDHAPQDMLDLLPGHAYFLARDENELKGRFKHDLLPLLDEYLREGLLGPGSIELHAVRDAIEDFVSQSPW